MERRMFETGVVSTSERRALTLPCSVAIHTLVAGALVIVPLLGEGELPEVAASGARVFFAEPQVPPVPPPPPALVKGPPRAHATTAQQPQSSNLVTPPVIPDFIPEEVVDPGFGDGNGARDGVDGGWGDGSVRPIVTLPPAPAAPPPVRVGGVVREPRKLQAAPPVYPPLAIQAHVQGDVTLECVISAQGRVTEATVVSGSPLLAPAARAAVLQWVYAPTLLNGMPVPILLRVSVQFHLR
jgi:TonB family protein